MSLQKLSGKQLRHLRALAHALNPVVQMGKQGWTQQLRAQLDEALLSHELIKLKLGTECPAELEEVAAQAETELEAVVAQTIGRTLVLYRRHPEKPRIVLPKRTTSPE